MKMISRVGKYHGSTRTRESNPNQVDNALRLDRDIHKLVSQTQNTLSTIAN